MMKGVCVTQGWAAALLTLDTGADLSDAGDRTRLSTLGSAMLAALLRMPKARPEPAHHTGRKKNLWNRSGLAS